MEKDNIRSDDQLDVFNDRIERMSAAVKTILECVGEDSQREGLLDTPERFAKAMLFFTKGYTQNLSGECFYYGGSRGCT